jgi:hypothetical protein
MGKDYEYESNHKQSLCTTADFHLVLNPATDSILLHLLVSSSQAHHSD